MLARRGRPRNRFRKMQIFSVPESVGATGFGVSTTVSGGSVEMPWRTSNSRKRRFSAKNAVSSSSFPMHCRCPYHAITVEGSAANDAQPIHDCLHHFARLQAHQIIENSASVRCTPITPFAFWKSAITSLESTPCRSDVQLT